MGQAIAELSSLSNRVALKEPILKLISNLTVNLLTTNHVQAARLEINLGFMDFTFFMM